MCVSLYIGSLGYVSIPRLFFLSLSFYIRLSLGRFPFFLYTGEPERVRSISSGIGSGLWVSLFIYGFEPREVGSFSFSLSCFKPFLSVYFLSLGVGLDFVFCAFMRGFGRV